MKNNSMGKIALLLENGKIAMKVDIKKISQAELSMLISHLEVIKNTLLGKYAQGLKKVEEQNVDGK